MTNQGMRLEDDNETKIWVCKSRRFPFWQAAAVVIVLAADAACFLWSHEFPAGPAGFDAAIERVLGESVDTYEALTSTVDTFVAFVSVAWLLVMVLVGILFRRPPARSG